MSGMFPKYDRARRATCDEALSGLPSRIEQGSGGYSKKCKQFAASKATAKNSLAGSIDAVSLKDCICEIKTNGNNRHGMTPS